ncbi:MAG: gluconokinase [Pyrinomonadaceae bacterium]
MPEESAQTLTGPETIKMLADASAEREDEEAAAIAAPRPFVLAIDIGTSSVRASVFDGRGREVSGTRARVERSFRTTPDGGAEADAEELVRQVESVVDASLARSSVPSVEAVAVACFWHSLVGIDGQGRALTPVYGWADTRAAGEAEALRRRWDEREMHRRTGCRFHAGYWPAKLLWLRKENPEMYGAIARWLSPGEFLTLNLCGEAAASVSMASGTGLLNQRRCEWDEAALGIADLEASQLPPLAEPGLTFRLTDEYARRWPQLRDARLFPAIGDGAANNIGAGCVDTRAAGLMIGTSGAMRVTWAGEPPETLPDGLWCYRVDYRRVLVGGALSDGGGLYGWLSDSLKLGAEANDAALAALEPDAHGLTVLPFWAGERSTGWSAQARGAILGLSMDTRPVDIVRAALEAIAYRFALIAEALLPFAPQAEIQASGGALRASPTWTQILADVLGRPLRLAPAREASSRGAVLLALEALGVIEDIASVPTLSPGQTFIPNPARRARYLEGLARQQRAYDAIVRGLQ